MPTGGNGWRQPWDGLVTAHGCGNSTAQQLHPLQSLILAAVCLLLYACCLRAMAVGGMGLGTARPPHHVLPVCSLVFSGRKGALQLCNGGHQGRLALLSGGRNLGPAFGSLALRPAPRAPAPEGQSQRWTRPTNNAMCKAYDALRVGPHCGPACGGAAKPSTAPYDRPTAPYDRPTAQYDRPTAPYDRPWQHEAGLVARRPDALQKGAQHVTARLQPGHRHQLSTS